MLAEFEKSPVGTGPFKSKEWEKGRSITLVRKLNNWKLGRSYLDGVTFITVSADNTRLLQVRGRQAHVDESPTFNLLASVRTDSNITVLPFDSSETTYLIMSQKAASFGDKRVRAAIAHSADK